MFSRQEVADIERYEAEEKFKENEKRYGHRLVKQIERLEKLLAFYMGEDKPSCHPLEKEYIQLANIRKGERTSVETYRLAKLANILIDAVDASDNKFKEELDKE